MTREPVTGTTSAGIWKFFAGIARPWPLNRPRELRLRSPTLRNANIETTTVAGLQIVAINGALKLNEIDLLNWRLSLALTTPSLL